MEKLCSVPRKKWTLTEDAFPTIFSNCNLPQYYNKSLRKRKAPTERECASANKKSKQPTSKCDIFTQQMTCLQDLIYNKEKIVLPSENWIARVAEENTQLKLIELEKFDDEFLHVKKQIVINSNLNFNYFVSGVDVSTQFQNHADNLKDVNALLSEFHDMAQCEGIPNFENVSNCKAGIKRQQSWYSTKIVHINPNSFQKMRVYLATQIFSSTMADGIKFYRDQKLETLIGSEQTENFTRKMNDLFDSLNVSESINGLKIESEHYNTIVIFIKLLNENEHLNNFASPQTMESLRVTLQSTKDIIDYLIKIVEYSYVLTSKLNQDCLEKFFGIVRSMGGDDDHPTVINFLHIFRMLCIYSPTAQHLRGNVRNNEDYKTGVVDYVELLRKGKKCNADVSSSKRKTYEDDLLKKIVENYEMNSSVDLDHDYCKLPSSNCIAFHLAGFVAFKAEKFTKCVNCIDSLSLKECPLVRESALTKIKYLGGLKFPTQFLSDFIIKVLEPAVSNVLMRGMYMLGDIVREIIDSMDFIPCKGLGCALPMHSASLIVHIVTYYVTIRLYFYSRTVSREVLSSRAECNKKMKEAKLK